MATWDVFDARCVVGRHGLLQKGGLYASEDLLDEMDHFGVAEALVLDSLSRECSPSDGNARILRVSAASSRLHPAWSVNPPGVVEEQPDPETLLRQMRTRGVGALFLLPGQFKFSLSDWCVDALLEPLAEARAPIFIDPNDRDVSPDWDETDWEGVVALCRRWPRLPVVVSEWRIRRSQRMIYRALDACANLRIELSGYWLYRGIEYVTRRWGAKRLIFGSNWPILGHGPTLAALTCAEISDEDKRLIAGDNLRDLVSWCEPVHDEVRLPEPADSYVLYGRTGKKPKSMRFMDCHGHIGNLHHYHVPDNSVEEMISEMDRLGIAKTCIFGFAGITSDERFGNDVTIKAVRRYPGRFVGFTVLNPHRGKTEMLKELRRCAREGLKGIKLIPWYQRYPEDGPLIEVACQWAHERSEIILNHNWGSADHLERLLSRYGKACFIAGHTTTAYKDLMARFQNLFVCSCPLLGPRDCEMVVAEIGAGRLLFGSDMLDLPIPWGLGPILFSRLSQRDKRLILGGNLQRILKIYRLSP